MVTLTMTDSRPTAFHKKMQFTYQLTVDGALPGREMAAEGKMATGGSHRRQG
jgi:hypothetical protein